MDGNLDVEFSGMGASKGDIRVPREGNSVMAEILPRTCFVVVGVASWIWLCTSERWQYSTARMKIEREGLYVACELLSAVAIFAALQILVECYKRIPTGGIVGEPPNQDLLDLQRLSFAEQRNWLEDGKELLKPHRFAGAPLPEFMPGSAFPDDGEPNAFIVTCDKEMTRVYRQLIHNTLFTKKSVQAMTQFSHERAVEIAEDWVTETDEEGVLSLQSGCESFLRAVLIELVCNPQRTQALDDSLVESLDRILEQLSTKPKVDQRALLSEFVELCAPIEGSVAYKMKNDEHSDDAVVKMIGILRGAFIQNTFPMLRDAIRECAADSELSKKVRTEIAELIEDRLSLEEAISQSSELRKILQETLRIDLPVKELFRHSGSVSFRELAHMPALVGEDPFDFRPERFDEIKGGSPSFWPSLSFLPFGHGRHVCPGWKASVVPATQLIGVLLYNYTFTQEGDSPYSFGISKRV